MKQLMIIFITTFIYSGLFGQARLYPFCDGSRWGYIDKNGKTIIKPRFFSAADFSEGLAAVRVNGRYGYIDTTGNIVIPPLYDLAIPFEYGLGKVFIDGKPFFIDRKANIIFQHPFKSITKFGYHSFAVATTFSDKYCLISRQGKMLTDTVFKKIHGLGSGLVIVEGLNHLPYSRDSGKVERFESGVIDTFGKWMIPYGRYKRISQFKNGYATAERFDQTEKERGWTTDDAVIDAHGNLKFIAPVGKYYLASGDKGFYDGLAIATIYPEDNDTSRLGHQATTVVGWSTLMVKYFSVTPAGRK